MRDEKASTCKFVITRYRQAMTWAVCLAAISVVTLGAISAEAGENGLPAGHIQLVDERRPGIDPDARRPGLKQDFPETARDRQRPGYRPGAFERRIPRDCLQDRRSAGSHGCR